MMRNFKPYIISSNDLSIILKPLKMGNALEIFCDVNREKVRPYVPEELRFEVYFSLSIISPIHIIMTHKAPHPRPLHLAVHAKCTRCCVACQRSKVQRHTVSPIQPFAPIVERF
ncbi:hypothetical protein TNIN_4521 [Trichonephila inaurata madagascariensis]|uniref:Uncharacterized protein n=1 Tax=Trichonephila inaurata madagascariensis TaxID=2747483 RepID=A0A8X6XTQ8_9ARAC|nr:hypothetical protein TNIN_4521 [Trichonephila inaurata madagascariensis]